MNINCLFFFSSSITTSFPNTFLPGKFKLQISPKADWGYGSCCLHECTPKAGFLLRLCPAPRGWAAPCLGWGSTSSVWMRNSYWQVRSPGNSFPSLYLPATKNSRRLTHPTLASLKVSVGRLFTHCCTQVHNTKSLQSVTQHWITSPKLLYLHSWKCTGEITSLSQNPHHSYYHGGRAISFYIFF